MSIKQKMDDEACSHEKDFKTLLNPSDSSPEQQSNASMRINGLNPAELAIQALTAYDAVVVTTAGNDGIDTDDGFGSTQAPASYEHVVTVAAIDDKDARVVMGTWGSDAHEDVDIDAPGSCILSTINPPGDSGKSDCYHTADATTDRRETITPTPGAGFKSGTSMAAPAVSGVMAHLRARFPDTSVSQLTEAIYVTASPGKLTNCSQQTFDQFTNPPANPKEARRLCYGHGIIEPLDAAAYLEATNPSIAFLTDDRGSQQVAIMNLDGSDPRVLTENENSKWSPSLSPDGSRIVFAEQSGAQQDLWIINRDKTGLTLLTNDSGFKFAPAWAPDGSRISYVRNNSRRCGFLWLWRCTGREVWTIAPNGTDPTKIYSIDGDIFSPSWTYDSEHLVLNLDGDIVELDVNNGDTRTILSGGDSKAHICPSPSPDGQHIAFATWRDGQDDVVVTDMQGSYLMFLATSDSDDYCPVWAPDGDTLIFVSDRDGDSEIYSVSLDGGDPQPLTSNSSADFQPSIAKSTVSLPGELNPLLESARQFILSLGGSEGRATALSSTWDHVCGPVDDGAVNCWGESVSSEVLAPSEAHLGASAGAAHSCAMDAEGSVVCWGTDFLGQADAPEGRFANVAAGWDHTCGLTVPGAVVCWGSNEHGQTDAPTGHFSAVSSGDAHSCAIATTGSIICWGLNDDGQADPPAGQYVALDTGSAHSCALDQAGVIACWGANWFTQSDPPEGSFAEVATGYGHTCALDGEGFATCWGLNNDLQANPPYRMFTTITAGRAHTCGLDIHAAIMCWGTLENGE